MLSAVEMLSGVERCVISPGAVQIYLHLLPQERMESGPVAPQTHTQTHTELCHRMNSGLGAGGFTQANERNDSLLGRGGEEGRKSEKKEEKKGADLELARKLKPLQAN